MNRLFSLAAVTAVMFSYPTYATDDELVVTANRIPQPKWDINATTIIIDRETIEASQTKDVVELLRFEAGLEVGRNGGYGSTTSLFIRGAESNHTLVLIDGVKINPGTIGGAAIQNIHPSHIERIEIVKGPRSSLYGSEAIGGVVNIITRRATRANELYVDAGIGSDETKDVAVAYHTKSEQFRGGFSINRFSTDGYEIRTDNDEVRGYDNVSSQFYLGWQGDNTDIELSHWQVNGLVEYLSFFRDPVDQDTQNVVTSLKVKQTISDKTQLNATFSHVIDDVDQNQSNDFTHTERNSADVNIDMALNQKDRLIVGTHFSKENVSALVFGSPLSPERQPVTRIKEGYGQYLWYRGDWNGVVGLRHTDHEDFGSEITGEWSLGYAFNEYTRAYVAYATGFRAADNSDRFGFGGNADLDPEYADSAELGIDARLNNISSMGARLFYTRIDDLIVFDGTPSVFQNQNLDEAIIRGIEFDYKVETQTWSWDISAVIQDPFNSENGEQLARRAKRSLTNTLVYKYAEGQIGLQWLLSDTRPNSDFDNVINRGYGLLNLVAQWRLTDTLSLKARVENVTDREYVLANSFASQPRSAFIQLSYRH